MFSRLLVALAASILSLGMTASALAQDVGAALEVGLKDSRLPAMGLLVIRNGKVVAQAERGVRQNDATDPVQSSDVWHIGSDAKAMTATMIARLVDRGELTWTAPLKEMLPELTEDMRPEYRQMSLRDWAKFCVDQMQGANGHGSLLKFETYRLMQTPQPNSVYAFGWGVLPAAMGRQGPVFTHDGSDGTWYAKVVLFPSSESGVLAVANAGAPMGGENADKSAMRAVVEALAPAAKQ